MADKVVGFKIEIKGNKELLTTEKLLGMVNQQLTAINKNLDEINKKGGANLGKLSKQFKESATSAERLGTVVKSSFESFERGNKVVQDLGNGYFEVTRQVDKLSEEFKDSENSIKGLIARNKELKQVLEAAPIDQTSEELEKLKKEYTENNNAIKAFRKELRTGIKEQEASKGSIIELRQRAKQLKAEYEGLTDSQRKFSLNGRRLRKELLAVNKEIRNYNNSVSASGGLTRTLSRTFTRLFVGRSILSGAANILRNVGQGLKSIVEEGAATDDTLKGIEDSSKGLTNTLTNVGKSFLGAFGGVISSLIENVSFVVFRVSEALSAAANSGGIFGTIISGIGSVLSDFPAIFGGVIEVVNEFRNRFVNTFTEIGLGVQKVIANVEKLGTALTGGDTTEINERIASINEQLAENVIAARTIGQAYQEGFDATKQAQEEFNARTQEEIELQEKREKIAKASEEASKKRAADEKKRLEELARDRNELLKQIEANAQARISLTIQLGQELRDAEIASIQDTTERAIAEEKERFNRRKQARIQGFNELIVEAEKQEDEIVRIFGLGSDELIAFQKKTGNELLEIQSINNALIEKEEREHQERLNKIREDGAKESLEVQANFFDGEIEQLDAQDLEIEQREAEASDRRIKKQIEEENERKELRKKRTEEAVELAVATLGAVNQISEALFAAEEARFQESIQIRQANIQNLNEELQNATGLQKRFLEQQVAQEKKALAEETEALEKARKEQARQAQVIALIQAIINGALAITRAFSDLGPIAGAVAAVGVAAGIAAQIATISSQKFAEGGVLQGPSHSQGGIKTAFGELEGGEAVINKRSTAMFKPLLSSINVAGGGKKFQAGGVLGSPISAPSLASTSTSQDLSKFFQLQERQISALDNKINTTQVVLDLNNLQDVQDNDSTLDTLTTFN